MQYWELSSTRDPRDAEPRQLADIGIIVMTSGKCTELCTKKISLPNNSWCVIAWPKLETLILRQWGNLQKFSKTMKKINFHRWAHNHTRATPAINMEASRILTFLPANEVSNIFPALSGCNRGRPQVVLQWQSNTNHQKIYSMRHFPYNKIDFFTVQWKSAYVHPERGANTFKFCLK